MCSKKVINQKGESILGFSSFSKVGKILKFQESSDGWGEPFSINTVIEVEKGKEKPGFQQRPGLPLSNVQIIPDI